MQRNMASPAAQPDLSVAIRAAYLTYSYLYALPTESAMSLQELHGPAPRDVPALNALHAALNIYRE